MITKKDVEIISHLRSNSRKKITKIAESINMPVTTIYDRLRNAERRFIDKHTTLLDFSKIGYPVHSHVVVDVNKESKEGLYNFLLGHSNINSLYKINYGEKLLCETVFKNIDDFESFIESLEKDHIVSNIQVHHISEQLRKEDFLTDVNHIN